MLPFGVALVIFFIFKVLLCCAVLCFVSLSLSCCVFVGLFICHWQHEATFRADKTYTLIQRLAHNVIKTGLRKINSSYSRISLQDLCEKVRVCVARVLVCASGCSFVGVFIFVHVFFFLACTCVRLFVRACACCVVFSCNSVSAVGCSLSAVRFVYKKMFPGGIN